MCQDAKLRYNKAEGLRSIPSLSAHLQYEDPAHERITVDLLSHGACPSGYQAATLYGYPEPTCMKS